MRVGIGGRRPVQRGDGGRVNRQSGLLEGGQFPDTTEEHAEPPRTNSAMPVLMSPLLAAMVSSKSEAMNSSDSIAASLSAFIGCPGVSSMSAPCCL